MAATAKQTEMDDLRQVPQYERDARKTQNSLGGLQLGPDATDDEKTSFRRATKQTTNSALHLLWNFTKHDIKTTLSITCNKVLHDHSVSGRAQKASSGSIDSWCGVSRT